MPPHPSSSVFFAATPIFGRAEFAQAVGRHPSDRAVTELLKYHLGARNIRRIARGVFASTPKGALAATGGVDRFLAASRLRTGAVIAYRSALELHGYITSPTDEVQLIVGGEPGLVATADFMPLRQSSEPSFPTRRSDDHRPPGSRGQGDDARTNATGPVRPV